MPSNKKHILFSLIMVLPFFPDIFYISLAVIATSIIDLDRQLQNKNLMIMVLIGILTAIILYLINLPYMIGVILVILAIIFFISKHRGFAHSIFGITVITSFLSFFIMGSYLVLMNYTEPKINLLVILLFLGFLVLNEKLIVPYSILIIIGVLLSSNLNFNLFNIFWSILLGCLSHITLDLFTPKGVDLFSPLYSKKFHKITGMIFLILWMVLVVIHLSLYTIQG